MYRWTDPRAFHRPRVSSSSPAPASSLATPQVRSIFVAHRNVPSGGVPTTAAFISSSIRARRSSPRWLTTARLALAWTQMAASWVVRLEAGVNKLTLPTMGANPRLAMFNAAGDLYWVDDEGSSRPAKFKDMPIVSGLSLVQFQVERAISRGSLEFASAARSLPPDSLSCNITISWPVQALARPGANIYDVLRTSTKSLNEYNENTPRGRSCCWTYDRISGRPHLCSRRTNSSRSFAADHGGKARLQGKKLVSGPRRLPVRRSGM
jgi:hypothetical protein